MKEYLKTEYIPLYALGLVFLFGMLHRTPEAIISALIVLFYEIPGRVINIIERYRQ